MMCPTFLFNLIWAMPLGVAEGDERPRANTASSSECLAIKDSCLSICSVFLIAAVF